jgi:outer membrane scaffolding protein for murein synthesis (MipA/OmpV family)
MASLSYRGDISGRIDPVVGKLSATFSAEVQYLSGNVTDSPIIARRVVPSAMAGLFHSS